MKTLIGGFDGIKIFIVDGHNVRTNMDTDFTLGSHGLLVDYIPKDEIWIEKMINPIDESINLSHEIFEYLLMRDKKLIYDDAHEISICAEKALRSIIKGGRSSIG